MKSKKVFIRIKIVKNYKMYMIKIITLQNEKIL